MLIFTFGFQFVFTIGFIKITIYQIILISLNHINYESISVTIVDVIKSNMQQKQQ